jgi:phosphoribosylanthranilate isomerase
MKPRIKVCGVTRFEDALLAADLGAWAVGFIFYKKSPRYIDPAKVKKIVAALPREIEKVGVFVNASLKSLLNIQRESGITLFQLHGDETPELVRSVPTPVIKALRLVEKSDLEKARAYNGAWAILVEGATGNERGGTGVRADWDLARQLVDEMPRVILAGGLNALNKREAQEEVGAFGLDLSSGIEDSPGVKNDRKMREFFCAGGTHVVAIS